MKDDMATLINENKFKEATIYVEDTEFSILTDYGVITHDLPKNYVYNESGTVPLHFHSFYELCVSGGSLTIMLENGSVTPEASTIIIMPPNYLHAQKSFKQQGEFLQIPFSIAMNFSMRKFSHTPEFSLYETAKAALCEPVFLKVPRRLLEIIALFDSDNPKNILDNRLMLSLYFHEFITTTLDLCGASKKLESPSKETDSNTSRSYKLHMMIYNCYNTNITIEQVAKKMKMSTRQISRIINSTYKCTFRELICSLRMKRASYLLLNTNKTISEISSEVGFSAVKGFYNSFKKTFGCLPTEYRVNNSQKQGRQDEVYPME